MLVVPEEYWRTVPGSCAGGCAAAKAAMSGSEKSIRVMGVPSSYSSSHSRPEVMRSRSSREIRDR